MINYLDPKQIRKAFNDALAKTIQENKMKAMQAKMRNNVKIMSKTQTPFKGQKKDSLLKTDKFTSPSKKKLPDYLLYGVFGNSDKKKRNNSKSKTLDKRDFHSSVYSY